MKDIEDCKVILRRVLNKLFPHIDVDSIIYNQKKGLSQGKHINVDTLTSHILSFEEQEKLYCNYAKKYAEVEHIESLLRDTLELFINVAYENHSRKQPDYKAFSDWVIEQIPKLKSSIEKITGEELNLRNIEKLDYQKEEK